MSLTNSPGSSCPVDQPEEGDLRVNGAHDHRRTELLAALEDDAFRATVPGEDPSDPCIGTHLAARVLRGAANGVRNGTHAALRIAPGAELAVADVSDGVVQEHVGGSG
jgi:hypothetical protein